MSDFSKGSFLMGMSAAVDQIRTEYEACQFEFEGDDQKLAIIKSAFMRAIGLIEDEMIQYGAGIKINELVDKFNEETMSKAKKYVGIPVEMLDDIIAYVINHVVSWDGEYGKCRDLDELIKDGDMPALYHELIKIKVTIENVNNEGN